MPETPTLLERVADTLTQHQRMDASGCLCGWGRDARNLGASYSEHVARFVEAALGDHHATWRDRAVRARAEESPANKHSQMCPVWTGRSQNVGVDRCNCWILRNAEHVVDVVLAALDGPAKIIGGGQ
jgi:hypothetical protein